MKPKMTNKVLTPYDAGYDAGRNGANTTNCHFSLFSTAERTKDWERGNADGSHAMQRAARRLRSPAERGKV